MRCVRLENDFGINNLRLREAHVSKPGPFEVLVDIHACSLNYRDLLVVRGQYNPRQALPLIPVSDGAGEVIEVGDQVREFKKGDRVCPTFSQKWSHTIASIQAKKNTL